MGVSNRIRRLCRLHNMTINKLERELGIGRGNVARWDNHKPSSERLSKVANFFGVSVDYLLGFSMEAEIDDAEEELIELEKQWEQSSGQEREKLGVAIDLKRESLEDLRFAQEMQRAENENSQKRSGSSTASITDRDIRAAFFNGHGDDLSEDEQDALWADAQAYMAFKLSQRKKKEGD